ncbi:uncharacterized protein LOC134827147 [Culicoides brevitarsis]|uniref:uncharacterized protein LOC134827147 n=1 Tax=Culicoides brevitarsis TaxID=469753 RepID=UPI00307B3E29
MNSKLLITICVAFLAQNAYAGIVKRDTAASGPPAAPDFNALFADLFQQAQQQVATLSSKFLEAAGIENKDQLLSTVQTKTEMYATKVGEFVKTIQDTLASQQGAVNEKVQGLTTTLQNAVKKLQEQNPDLVKATQQYKESVGQQFQGIVAETQKLATALQGQAGGVSEQLNTAVKGIVQETANTATQLVEKVDMAIKQKHDFPEEQKS